MLGKELRECLHKGKNVYGTHVTYMSNINAAGMLLNVGLDYAFICGEHMPLDRVETGMLCRFFSANGVAPIVRISHPSAVEAAKALDVGAHGIVAPYIETEEQVKALVGAVRYRPLKGRKLQDIINSEKPLSLEMQDFFDDFNRNNLLIIGIESEPAVENLDALINVKGVDGVFIGPHDMCASLGCPDDYTNPRYQQILEEVIIKCRRAGIGVGAHVNRNNTSDERMKELMGLGMNWILDASDINYAVASLSARRKSLGFGDHKPLNDNKICAAPRTCAMPKTYTAPKTCAMVEV